MFKEESFTIGTLKGISSKNIEEHLKLYAGYVKHTNLILEKIDELSVDSEKNAYLMGELQRRFGFEFNGMRNHEYYFKSLSGSATVLSEDSLLKEKITTDFGSFETWLTRFKAIALTRGIGWAMLYYDKKNDKLLNAWVDEQHLGQLGTCEIILALDMWEHAFVYDYPTSQKKEYVDSFFNNLNWQVIDENYRMAH